MAYSVEDENGDIGAGPSGNGLSELRKFVLAQADDLYPSLRMLLMHGVTHQVEKLTIECRALASKCTDKDIKSTLSSLAISSAKAEGIVMFVSHHVM
jgi:hypothetical protein